jgi:FkbM family methyltransferase
MQYTKRDCFFDRERSGQVLTFLLYLFSAICMFFFFYQRVTMFKLTMFFLSLTCIHLNAFEILPQCKETEALGFGEWNIAIDGEALLMQKFLKPNDVVFDIGGNHGEWSTFALKYQPSIQIMTFEPVPFVFKSLKNALEPYSNVQLFNYALSDQSGTAVFHYYPEADGLSGFYYREVLRGDHPDPLILEVNQTTLDVFCESKGINKIDFIKIDTEGAEWKILKGAKNLLKNQQIRAIQFEYGGCYVDAKTTLRDVMLYFKENRYIVFRIVPTGLVHIAKWKSSLENYHLSNYFAICEEDLPGYGLIEFSE